MKRITAAAASIASLLGAAMGAYVTMYWYDARDKSEANVICRPSAPELLADGPKVLFWGNSLAFDHNWRLPNWTAINCARQGLTADASLPLVQHLPSTDVSAVVLVFGTVELVRGAVDLNNFRMVLNASLTKLETTYPGAKFIVVGVPEGSAATWRYGGHQDLEALNTVLRNLPKTEFLDTTSILSGVPESSQTYDGAHLAFRAYLMIEAEILKSLSDITSR